MRKGAVPLLLAVSLAGALVLPGASPGLPYAWGKESAGPPPRSPVPPPVAAAASHPLGLAASVGGGQGRILVTSSDTAIVPNDGLRVNVTGFFSPSVDPNSAFQVGAEETIGQFEAVFGIFENAATLPTAFFSVFTNRTDQNVHLLYWPALPLVPGDAYDFMLLRANGTNWTLTVNGALFGGNRTAATYDFLSPTATWATSVGFSEVAIYQSTPTVPPFLSASLAFAVHHAGAGWYLPTAASATFLGTGGAQWGIQGRLQHFTLAPGEVETGSQVANVTNGTPLWSGGPVPVRVTVELPVTTVVATTPVPVIGIVTTVGGAPVPGVSLYVHDSLNGSFVVPRWVTNGTGAALSLLDTPNVSRASSDLLTAVVTLFGYSGTGSGSLGLTPPEQVVLSVSPGNPTVAPRGQITLTFRSANATGGVIPGVLLSLSLLGSGGVEPNFGATDSGGGLPVVLLAPANSGDVVLVAAVDGVGQWGRLSVTVHVSGKVAGFPVAVVYTGLEVGALVVLALATILLVRRYLRGRKSLPDMPLRRYLRETRARPPSPPPPAPPGEDAPSRKQP